MTPSDVHPVVAEAGEHDLIDPSLLQELSAQLEAVHVAWPKSGESVLLVGRRLSVDVVLREVRIRVVVELGRWPEAPPVLRVIDGPWFHPNLLDDRVLFLSGLKSWNRTVTLDQLLRELERGFIDHPPQRRITLSVLLRRVWDGLRR